MTTPFTLPASQQTWVSNIDAHIKRVAAIAASNNTYKLGDVYVLEMGEPNCLERSVRGEPIKYQVVYVSPMGAVYLQKLSSTGTPSGELVLPPEIDFLRHVGYSQPSLASWRFIQDPDQLDAIMLQQEYDPMKQHNENLQLGYKINKHNKSALIPTGLYDHKTYIGFLKNLKLGDSFWTGIDKQYIVHKPAEKRKGKWIITVLDMNQQQVEFYLNHFSYKRLYKERPRSFAKEVEK